MPDTTCAKCGAATQTGDLFCRHCGAALTTDAPSAKIARKHPLLGLNCPDCGNAISEDDLFCRSCGANLFEPIEPPAPTVESTQRKRGFWLTAALILWLVVNSGLALYYLVMVLTPNPYTSFPALLWLLFRGVTNVIFLIALWKWKKWGVYGLLTMLVIGTIVTMFMGMSIPTFIGAIIGVALLVVILYFLLRKVWAQMD